MRVSTNAIYRTGIESIQRGQNELNSTQLQMSSGKRILTPSDDPSGAVQALQLRQRIAAVEQFGRNANYATTRLQQEETVVQQMGDALQRVRELTVQAANATQTDESRQSIAAELRQIRVSLVNMANNDGASEMRSSRNSTSAPLSTGKCSCQLLLTAAAPAEVRLRSSARSRNGIFSIAKSPRSAATG